MLFESRQVERRQSASGLLTLRSNVVRRRDQTGAEQVAVRAKRAFLGEFGCISANGRDRAGMGILDVDVERPRAGIFEGADRLIGRRDAVDGQALQPVTI